MVNPISSWTCEANRQLHSNRFKIILSKKASNWNPIIKLMFFMQFVVWFNICQKTLKIQYLFQRDSRLDPKIYIPSTLNIDLIPWHKQLFVCAVNVKSWFKSWVISFTFQAYTLSHTLNCICVSLFKFHIWILKQF